jgi:hypothetical protein
MEGSRDTELPNQFLGLRNFAPLVCAFMSPQQPEQFLDMTWILQHWDIVFVLGKGSKKDEGRLEIAINCNIVQVYIVYCIYMSYIRIYIIIYLLYIQLPNIAVAARPKKVEDGAGGLLNACFIQR